MADAEKAQPGREEMQFGLYCTNGHVTVGSPEIAAAVAAARQPLEEGHQDLQFEFGLQVALAAEKAGFDLMLFAERHLGPDLTTWVSAGAIGSRLERMMSMVAVHPGLWHPTLVAKLSTTLDRLCKGGMAINLVTGANEAEFRMFGSDTLTNTEARYVRATEFVKVIRGMWEEDRYSLNGQIYQVENAELRLKPRRAVPPPIFTAANSELGREMIAEVGDWWFLPYDRTITSTDQLLRELDHAMADMRKRMDRYGRKVRFGFNPFVGFGPSADAALDNVLKRVVSNEANPDTSKIRHNFLPATHGGCIGRPEDVRRQIARFRDMGIEYVLFKMTAGVDDVQQVGQEIISEFALGRH